MQKGMRWYCVETYPAAEKLAYRHIAAQQFVAFLPFELVQLPQCRFKLEPFFPGYLFVMFDITRGRWASLNNTIGVKRLLGYTKAEPAPVRPGIVEGLRILAGDDDVICVKKNLPPPRPLLPSMVGQTMRIVEGIFAQQQEVVQGICVAAGKDRVKLLVETIHGQRPLTISRKHVELVS